MKQNSLRIIFLSTCVILLCVGSIYAKGRKEGKGNNKSDKGMIPYKSSTFTTIKGSVQSSEAFYNKHMKEDGLHLKVKTDDGEFIVHVCPQWYAEKENIQFKKGEFVTITGSTFTKDNEENIYAATISRKGDDTLNLRNPDDGETLWSGRYQKKGMGKK
jgi:hypothetical protein